MNVVKVVETTLTDDSKVYDVKVVNRHNGEALTLTADSYKEASLLADAIIEAIRGHSGDAVGRGADEREYH